MHFGATLRMLRVDAGIGLRELAGRIGVSSAYLSRVEHGRDGAPTPDRLAAIADVLQMPRALLFDLAQQTGSAASGYLSRVPEAGMLLLEIARRNLGRSEISRIKAFIDREFPNDDGRTKNVRLLDLLSPQQVVLHVNCADVDDLIAIATSRLPASTPSRRRDLAVRMGERERDAPTLLGSGFVAPHAVVPGARPAAALLVLDRPLQIESPDAKPVHVAVAIVSPTAGARHLQLLARVALLASRGAGEELVHAKSPEQALATIERIESMW
jgi:PTS system nitrogen regulatory IIA component